MNKDSITQETIINTSIDAAWDMLTTAEGIKAWYAFGGAAIDPRPGGTLVFRWDEHGEYHGVIEEIEPKKRLVFRFAPFEPDIQPADSNATRVTIELIPNDGTSTVRLIESGYQNLAFSPEEIAENYRTSEGAWIDALGMLKDKLEKSST